MLIANTDVEAKQLIELYDADPAPRRGGPPRRRPRRLPARYQAGARAAARAARGRRRADVRRPDPAAEGARRAAPRGARRCSSATRRCATGWSSRSSAARPAPAWSTPSRWPSWPPSLGVDDVVRFVPPVAQAELADWYAAATLVVRAVVQRVLRAGRRRGAGLRHPGRRGRRRRPDHGGARRRHRAARRRPRPRRLRRGDRADRARRPTCAAELSRGRARAGPPFAWERTADRTLEVYRAAAASMRDDLAGPSA